MNFKNFFPGLFLVLTIFNSCNNNTENEYNRFQGSNEYYNKIRMLYIEKNYTAAGKYIDKIKINTDIKKYLTARIYYKIKNFKKSLEILNKIKKNSEIYEYVAALKLDNYYKLKNYNNISSMATNIKFKNYFLKYKVYKYYALAFEKIYNKNMALKYYNMFFIGYNKFYNWKIKTFLKDDFDIYLFNFINILIKDKKVQKLSSVFVENFYNIRKKTQKKLLAVCKNPFMSDLKKITPEKLLSLAKIYFYNANNKTAESMLKTLILQNNIQADIKLKAYYFLALINKSKTNKFTEYVNNIIILFNNSDKALYYVGRAYKIKGDFNQSKKIFSEIISRSKNSKYKKLAYLELLSIYKNKNEYSSILTQAIENFPYSKDIKKMVYLFSLKKINNGNYSDALLLLDKINSMKESLFFKGKIYNLQGDNEKAFYYFDRYIKVSRINFFTIMAGKYIKKIYKKNYKTTNEYTKYFLGEIHTRDIPDNIMEGKYFPLITRSKNFKLLKKFFQAGLTFEGKLELYILKNKFKKNKTELYFSLLKYFEKENILNESLNLKIILLKRLKYYKYLFFFKAEVLKKFFPMYYFKHLSKLIKKYKLDKYYVYSLMYAESMFNPEATSIDNAMGLFQLIPSTARLVAKKVDYKNESAYNVVYNSHLGLKYLSYLVKKFNNNYILALGAYNAGGRRMTLWKKKYNYNPECKECFIEQIPFTETRNYLKKILFLHYFYMRLYK